MKIVVPDIGNFENVEVIEVLVADGDTIAPEQGLITIETDKAAMDVPSTHAGKVTKLLVKAGDKVSKGSAIVELTSELTSGSDTEAEAPALKSDASVEASVSDPEVSSEGSSEVSSTIALPFETLSPAFTSSFVTVPACVDGTSIAALSVSMVISPCSTATSSPSATRTSITSTSAKLPMSGTVILTAPTLRRRAALSRDAS